MIGVTIPSISVQQKKEKKQNGTWATFWPCFSLFVFVFCGRGAFKFAKHCGFPPGGCKFDKLLPLLCSAVCGKSGSFMWNPACTMLRTEALVQWGQTLGAVPHWGNMNQVMSKCYFAGTNSSKADTCVSEPHRSTFFFYIWSVRKLLNVPECSVGIQWFKKSLKRKRFGVFFKLSQCSAEC